MKRELPPMGRTAHDCFGPRVGLRPCGIEARGFYPAFLDFFARLRSSEVSRRADANPRRTRVLVSGSELSFAGHEASMAVAKQEGAAVKVTNGVALGGLTISMWWPTLMQASEIAGAIVPILSALWLMIQIVRALRKPSSAAPPSSSAPAPKDDRS